MVVPHVAHHPLQAQGTSNVVDSPHTTWQALGAARTRGALTRLCPQIPVRECHYQRPYVSIRAAHSVSQCGHMFTRRPPLFQRIVSRRFVKRAWEVKRIRRAQVTTDALEATRAAIPTFTDLAAFRSSS